MNRQRTKKWLWWSGGTVLIGAAGLWLCFPYWMPGATKFMTPYLQETSYPVFSPIVDFARVNTLQEMNRKADLVAEVRVASQETTGNDDQSAVSTRSQVDVLQVFKGDKSLKTATVYEFGGPVKMRVQLKGETLQQAQEPKMVEYTNSGSPVMKQDGEYFVFLRKTDNGYNVVGSVQGKIRIDPENGQGVVTVDKDWMNRENVFWFQKKFAGKGRRVIEQALRDLQR
jgi:hypothetical protein